MPIAPTSAAMNIETLSDDELERTLTHKPIDLLIKAEPGSQYFDARQEQLKPGMDIAFVDGEVTEVERSINVGLAKVIRRVPSNGIICPGLTDIHVHLADPWGKGINEKDHHANRGVVHPVDAGTTGRSNFSQFRRTVINTAQSDVRAFLNIAAGGMAGIDR